MNFPFDSAFVHAHWCPWDYGCRCHWVPLSEDDAHDIRKGDAKLPPDQRTLIEGQQLDHLQITGHLVRGINQITDVRTPVEKNGPDAYSFNPQDIHIPIEKLQGRYDSQTWNQFQQWASKTRVHDGGTTVWEWMGGKKITSPETLPPREMSFGNVAQAKAWADAMMNPHSQGFSLQEIQTLKEYQSIGHDAINRGLRGLAPLSGADKIQIHHMDAAMQQSKTPVAVTVYRGLNRERCAPWIKLKNGDEFKDEAFGSTSLSHQKAMEEFARGLVLKIHIPADSPGIYLDGLEEAHEEEVEILLPRDSQFEVLSKETRDGIVTLEVNLIL